MTSPAPRRSRLAPSEAIRTTCPYCGVGCGVLLGRDGAGRIAVKGDPDHPANFGRLCSKGTALAETLGSVAASLVVDSTNTSCVGLEINANHIRSARAGFVTGVARPIHLGGSTQVWDIRITDEQERLICICRLTMAVLKRAALTDRS